MQKTFAQKTPDPPIKHISGLPSELKSPISVATGSPKSGSPEAIMLNVPF